MNNNTEKTAVIVLGSNMGNRLEMLRLAIRWLERGGFKVTAKSLVWETAPWGITNQPRFLNMCVMVSSGLEPLELLASLKEIERLLGRKESVKWGPRVIDIDIIIVEDKIIDQPDLKIPHPYMQDRAFVLAPLAEIAPWIVHPRLKKTVKELLQALPEEKMDWIIRI